jgi:LysR family transcriptional activator of glutamate synthase operon
VDTETLRWLVSVADGSTVGETAAACHTSQPAVTRGLQRLGGAYGVPLTERVGRRVRLTFAGEIVAASARRALSELDESVRAVAEANDPASGIVRLGFLAPLGTWLVPRLLVAFRAERPAVRFELRYDGASRIHQALLDGELDLLLCSRLPEPQVVWERLFDEELVLAVPAGHRLAGRRRVRIAELTDEPWVMLPPGHGLRMRVEELCREAGFEPRQAFEGHDLATLFALIGAGSGVGLFPTRPAPPPGVVQVALAPAVLRSVGLARLTGRAHPRAVGAFAELVRSRAGQESFLRAAETFATS